MSDLIERQAVLDALCEDCDACEGLDIDGCLQAYRIKAVPSAQQWIPCSKRLPEKEEEVLLQCTNNMIVGYWRDGDFENEKHWMVLSGDGWESDCDFPMDVFAPIAWMPLPEPYKEEKA